MESALHWPAAGNSSDSGSRRAGARPKVATVERREASAPIARCAPRLAHVDGSRFARAAVRLSALRSPHLGSEMTMTRTPWRRGNEKGCANGKSRQACKRCGRRSRRGGEDRAKLARHHRGNAAMALVQIQEVQAPPPLPRTGLRLCDARNMGEGVRDAASQDVLERGCARSRPLHAGQRIFAALPAARSAGGMTKAPPAPFGRRAV
jgi:hypothetical protein